MNIFLITLFTLNLGAIASATNKIEYQVREDETSKKIAFKEFGGLELSESCFKLSGKPKCTAYDMATKKIALGGDGSRYVGNPAATYCKSMNGKSAIAKAKNNAETDVCRFNDGSYVKSWSAYYKHYPNTPIKK